MNNENKSSKYGLTLSELVRVTGGKLVNNGYDNFDILVQGITTNSKSVRNNSVFAPFHGSKHDGNDFLEEALADGCLGCLIEHELEWYRYDKFYVIVDDVLEALWKIAVFHRERMNTKLICVTGSVGKTSTSGMIASVLRQKYEVFVTEDNHNDEHLVPPMILEIKGKHDFAVIELGLGMNSSVCKMSKLLHPDMLVLTNIGYAHIAKTGSLYATRAEKCGTEEGLKPGGVVFFNGDDELLRTYPYKHTAYSYGSLGTLKPHYVDTLKLNEFVEPAFYYPAYAALSVGKFLHLSDEEISNGISAFVPERGRMDEFSFKSFTLIDSTFNASPASMKMALFTLKMNPGYKIAVLGDMLELGDFSASLHRSVGALIDSTVANAVIAIGNFAQDLVEGIIDNDVFVIKFDKQCKEAMDAVISLIKQNASEEYPPTAVLVKSSHGAHLHILAEELYEWGVLND